MLRQWGISTPDTYVLCGEEEEKVSYLFFNCIFSREVAPEFYKATNEVIWKKSGLPTPYSAGVEIRLGVIMDQIQNFTKGSNCWRLLWAQLGAISKHLWQERNSRWGLSTDGGFWSKAVTAASSSALALIVWLVVWPESLISEHLFHGSPSYHNLG